MPQVALLLLVHVFSAIFPPVDPSETTYYDILNVDRNATPEDIRKSYKKLSLKLHPDKVAQRGDSNAEEAAAEYEKVQEAYAVLANEQKRATYDLLTTPTRYRFYTQGGMANPGALHENMTGASFFHKTKLLCFVLFVILILLLQPILIAAKLNQTLREQGGLLTTSWFAIFVPYWIVAGLVIIITGILVPLVPSADRPSLCLSVLEQFFWYLAIIFLCFRWDGTWSSNYRQIFIPVYIAMLLRWIHSFAMLRKIRKDVERMVTVDFLEKEVLKGKDVEDLEESELKEIQEMYLVVTVPADFEPYAEEGVKLNEERIEEQKVEASPEFEAATEIYNNTIAGMAFSIVFGTALLILLTRKLDGKFDGSWWAVFSPMFLERGVRWLFYFHRCACGRMAGDEIVVQISNPGTDCEAKKDESNPEPQEKPESSIQVGKQPNSINEPASYSPNLEENSLIQQTESENETKTDNASKVENSETAIPESKDKSEDENIHIDEETFRAWQNAYAEAEESEKQEQAKAFLDCVSLSIQLIILCLIVGKVDQSYGSEDPSDVGFSTFWILFPFFLFFGFVCCCCTLIIYAPLPAGEEDQNETSAEEVHDPENPPSSVSTQQPMLVLPPMDEEKVTESAENADDVNEGEGESEVEASNKEAAKPSETTDIEDLD